MVHAVWGGGGVRFPFGILTGLNADLFCVYELDSDFIKDVPQCD